MLRLSSKRAIQLFLAMAFLPIALANAQDQPAPQTKDTCVGLAGPNAVGDISTLFPIQSAAERAVSVCLAEAASSPTDMARLAYLARAYGTVGKYDEMRKAIKRATASGDAAAEWVMGEILNDGAGRDPDAAKALTWYRRSAEKGFAAAQYALGYH